MNLQSLKNAIENKKVVPFYMPLVDLKTNRIIGLEVLARIIDENGEYVPPIKFISVAEENDLIDDITKIILDKACRFNKGLFHDGIKLTIAINVNSKQIGNDNIIDMIDRALYETQMPSDLLELEITENHDFENIKNVVANIEKLKEQGVECSIDDFGIGYSDFDRLTQLPISKVKIDASYIFELDKKDNQIFIKEVINMAQSLDIKTLAEGINNDDQIMFLLKAGCDYGQGFYYNEPVNENLIIEVLKNEA